MKAAATTALLAYAVDNCPAQLAISDVRELTLGTARQSKEKPARATIALPEEAIKSLRGAPDKARFTAVLVLIPADVAKRMDSRIILP